MSPWSGAKLLIGLLVVGLVLYGVWLLLGSLPIVEPFRTVIIIIFVLIALGYVMKTTGWWGGPPGPPA